MVAPFLDTNVLVYSISADARAEIADQLLAQPFVLSVQALNEFANVAKRKKAMSWEEIRGGVEAICLLADRVFPVQLETHFKALELVESINLSFYDALMLASALNAGCEIFYSEDLQQGMLVGDQLKIVNPFT